MIKAVKLKNFQSHKNNEFVFTEGVNAIVGPSDSGKTAILRALRWLIWNRPLGDAFRSDWGGDTEVTINIDDYLITRYRHAREHGYAINDMDLQAIGTNVPEEVSNIINIDEINLQQQFDKPFLLSDSPGEVAQHFNKVAHLESIDSAIKLLNSWHRKLSQSLQSHMSMKETYAEQIASYDYIPTMESMIEKAEALHEQKVKQEQDIENLLQLIDSLEEVALELDELTPLMSFEKLIQKYDKLNVQKKEKEARKNALYALLNALDDTSLQLEKLHSSTLKETAVNEALELYAERKKLWTDINMLSDAINETKSIIRTNKEITKETTHLQKKYHDNFPDTCPLCGSITKEVQI